MAGRLSPVRGRRPALADWGCGRLSLQLVSGCTCALLLSCMGYMATRTPALVLSAFLERGTVVRLPLTHRLRSESVTGLVIFEMLVLGPADPFELVCCVYKQAAGVRAGPSFADTPSRPQVGNE